MRGCLQKHCRSNNSTFWSHKYSSMLNLTQFSWNLYYWHLISIYKSKVNNAGMLNSGSIETIKMEDYDRIMNVNVRSVIFLTQLCVPHIIKEKGSIVNVSSVTGTRSFPGVLGYCMSKAAIDQFTKCTALGITYFFVNQVL
jgi:hypothetical protein